MRKIADNNQEVYHIYNQYAMDTGTFGKDGVYIPDMTLCGLEIGIGTGGTFSQFESMNSDHLGYVPCATCMRLHMSKEDKYNDANA